MRNIGWQKTLMRLTTPAILALLVSCGGPPSPPIEERLPAPDESVLMDVHPRQLACPPVTYPPDVSNEDVIGKLWVKALVDKKCKVRDALIANSSGVARLDSAAVHAAFDCTYTPAYKNGKPVAVWVTYKVEFDLQ